MSIRGSLVLNWYDSRLTWDPARWKFEELNILNADDIWLPEPSPYKAGFFMSSLGISLFKNVKTTYRGQVSATLPFYTTPACSNDHKNFPMDQLECCFDSDEFLDDESVKINVDAGNSQGVTKVEMDHLKSSWQVTQFNVTKVWGTENRDGDPYAPKLHFCVKAKRYSKTMRMQLSIPMAVSGVMVVVAPLFGTMPIQMMVKSFALLLQLVCFQFLVNLTPGAGLGSAMPKIYIFYEFTFAITLTSLLLTLIFNALSRLDKSLPPSHRLILISRLINKACCFNNNRNFDPKIEPPSSNHTELASSGKDGGSSAAWGMSGNFLWFELFTAINNFSSMILVAIYILGSFAFIL